MQAEPRRAQVESLGVVTWGDHMVTSVMEAQGEGEASPGTCRPGQAWTHTYEVRRGWMPAFQAGAIAGAKVWKLESVGPQ